MLGIEFDLDFDGRIPNILDAVEQTGFMTYVFGSYLLHRHGIRVAYHTEPDVYPRIDGKIPLEVFARAAEWVLHATGAKHVALIGASRFRWRPLSVHLSHPAPRDSLAYKRFFGVPVESGAPGDCSGYRGRCGSVAFSRAGDDWGRARRKP